MSSKLYSLPAMAFLRGGAGLFYFFKLFKRLFLKFNDIRNHTKKCSCKVFYHGGLYLITTSVEEGFMLPPNRLIKELIEKFIAQAQKQHPTEISHVEVSTTHIHFLARCLDPQDLADFMERFKCESAHAINRLLGRKRRTIWCKGYDSPLIVDFDTAIEKITYIYESPSKDGLTDNSALGYRARKCSRFKVTRNNIVPKRRVFTRIFQDCTADSSRTLMSTDWKPSGKTCLVQTLFIHCNYQSNSIQD